MIPIPWQEVKSQQDAHMAKGVSVNPWSCCTSICAVAYKQHPMPQIREVSKGELAAILEFMLSRVGKAFKDWSPQRVVASTDWL